MRDVFYLKRSFCQIIVIRHERKPLLLANFKLCISEMEIDYSTVRGVSFCFLNRYINHIEKGVAYVVRTRSSGDFVTARPRWRGLVRVTI